MKPSITLLAAILAAVSPTVIASKPSDSPPSTSVSAPEPLKMPKIDFEEYDLENGLHVILHRDATVPVVSTYVYYHVGSKDERPDRTGFAHFFEHLMFEGTANIARGQIDKLISAAGGNLNASTSFDRTDYYFNVPANQLGLALWVESERMLHAKVDEAGVETQRSVVKEERRQSVDNAPYGSVFENLAALVFAGTPYAWTPIGSAQYIDQATIEEFRDFYKKYYVPNNATLVIAGDFDVAATKKLVADYFGPIPKGAEIEHPKFTLPKQTEPKSKDVTLPTTPLPATIHAWRAPAETAKEAPALELLADILATGRSSRLYERLVRKEQLATDVEVFPYLLENGGVIGIFAVGTPGASLEKIDAIVTEEIERLRKEGVTAEELQKAKNQKLSSLASSFSTMQRRASSLAYFHVVFGNADVINQQQAMIDSVGCEDIIRAAQETLRPDAVNILRYPVETSAKPQ